MTHGENDSVPAQVGAACRDADDTLAIAETCTGGTVASMVTDVPGASEFFDRAFVPYSYDSLRTTLGIERATIDEHGVVSEPVTRQLAQRARDVADTTWGLSTTGIAGPKGGTAETPVGTLYIGVATAAPWETGASSATVVRRRIDGDRVTAKERMARAALEQLLTVLTADADDQ